MTSALSPDLLRDPWWRLTHLYYIQDKNGNRVRFAPWPEQRDLYENMWYLNVVLKARQRGMTTFIQLFMLDRCLFTPDTAAGVIAHTTQDAQAFFTNKIKFAYDNLPEQLRTAIPSVNSNLRELSFANGSRISVSTSHRSGTLQYLHVSEYGKLCAQYPDKAREVRAGALNTVAPGNFVFIESTAEGRQGHFFELCMASQRLREDGVDLTKMDYRFHFYPWWGASEYRLTADVREPKEVADYFEQLEVTDGIKLDKEQRAWYVKKSAEQGEDMKPEYPSTPGEAFERLLQGAIFAHQLRQVRDEGRIEALPHARGEPVNTFWDLGYNDINAIWFHQRVGAWDHFIDYYEHRLVDLTHYIEVLHELARDRGYQWGTVYLPHDGKSNNIAAIAGTASDILRRAGFKTRVVDRPVRKVPSIEMTRKRFASCRFDKDRCDEGLKRLENYQWVWDEQGDTYRKQPKHNFASNGADAFQTFGWGFRGGGSFRQQQFEHGSPVPGTGLVYSRKGSRRRLEPSYSHIL